MLTRKPVSGSHRRRAKDAGRAGMAVGALCYNDLELRRDLNGVLGLMRKSLEQKID